MGFCDLSRTSIIKMIQSMRRYDSVNNNNTGFTYNSRQDQLEVRLICRNRKTKLVCLSSLRKGDVIEVLPGQLIPCDGVIVEGYTTVDESAITGESAYVIREAGGDLSMVLEGTRVICNPIKIKVTCICKTYNNEECTSENEIIDHVNHINLGM